MNVPKTDLDQAKKIAIIGLGGGFDVFTGLPFVFHWCNKDFILINTGQQSTDCLKSYVQSNNCNYPEGLLPKLKNVEAVYSVFRLGVKPIKSALNEIFEKHSVDCILAVDGGVDSLATGDEEDYGTVLEDFITLAALDDILIPKILSCAGFGCETEENMNHYRILENMSQLSDSFLGSFSLTSKMPEFIQYKKLCEDVWHDNRKSHIHTKIISAVMGSFDKNNIYSDIDARVSCSTEHVFISMLSSIFWMFDLQGVLNQNKVIELMKQGNTLVDCKLLLRQFMTNQDQLRSHKILPL